MRDKLFFFAIVVLTAMTLSSLVAGMAVVVGHLAGLRGSGLLVVFGSTMAGVFGAVMTIAAFASNLFFQPPVDPDSSSGS